MAERNRKLLFMRSTGSLFFEVLKCFEFDFIVLRLKHFIITLLSRRMLSKFNGTRFLNSLQHANTLTQPFSFSKLKFNLKDPLNLMLKGLLVVQLLSIY